MRWQSKRTKDYDSSTRRKTKHFAILPELMNDGTWIWLETYTKVYCYDRDHGWDEDPLRVVNEVANNDLYSWYLQGRVDERLGTTSTVPDEMEAAYTLGATDYENDIPDRGLNRTLTELKTKMK